MSKNDLAGILAGRPLLTRKDLARRYGVSTGTIDRWLKNGILPPAVRVLRHLWRPEEIERWEKTRRGK